MKPKRIVIICPVCGKTEKQRYSKSRESVYRLASFRYGITVDRIRGDILEVFLPCEEHRYHFMNKCDEYLTKHKEAKKYFAKLLAEEEEKANRKALKLAVKEAKVMLSNLKQGEGLVFWVSQRYSENTPMEVYFTAVNVSGYPEIVDGSLSLTPAVSEFYATTHYNAQNARYHISRFNLKWRGIIQGVFVEGRDLYRLLGNIFLLTHEKPSYTLAGLLSIILNRHLRNINACEILEIIENAGKKEEYLILADHNAFVKKVREKVKAKFGIDPQTTIKAWEIRW